MSISRRDFLKFSTLLTASALFQPSLQVFPSRLSSDPIAKNILIIVFDAFSARNINFYGYPRENHALPHRAVKPSHGIPQPLRQQQFHHPWNCFYVNWATRMGAPRIKANLPCSR